MNKETNYINAHRVYQAMFLLPLLQQAACAGSDKPDKSYREHRDHRVLHAHRVLEVLGRRMASAAKPGVKRKLSTITDTCYPSIATICRETYLSDSTVRDALDNLIAWGFIRKTFMPGFPEHKGRHKPVYEHCRYWVVPEMWDWVWSPFGGNPPKVLTADLGDVPAPVPTPEDIAGADALDVAPEANPRLEEDQRYVQKLKTLLRERYGAHPTYRKANADALISTAIDDMMARSANARECWLAIGNRGPSDKETASIMASNHLDRYIKTCFTGWLEELRGVVEQERRDTLGTLILDQSHEMGVSQAWCREFEAWVAHKFGEDALDLTVDSDPEGAHMVRITFASFTPRLKFHYALDCTAPVTIDRLADESIDEPAADVAWFAAVHEPFVTAMRESGDPLGWFHEHRHEVEEAMAQGESSADELD
jgi:Helix-turn-helix domain